MPSLGIQFLKFEMKLPPRTIDRDQARRTSPILTALAGACGLLVSLAAPATQSDPQRAVWRAAYQPPPPPVEPADNRSTPERIALGKALFFDPRMSGSGLLSCASCHNPSLSWGDGLKRAVGDGHKVLARRTPTILNTAYAPLLFWDGRAASLEEQALGPIEAAGEMNMPLDEVVTALKGIRGYGPLFEAAYPGEGISTETIAKAIASFERQIISAPAPFDAWIAGDESAISEAAKRGFDLFNGKAACADCHSGWAFTDHSFHDIGVQTDDAGRGKLLPLPKMMHAFKTPTLRDVNRRAPYMHNGSEADLMAVIHLYDAGGRHARDSRSPMIRPLDLSAHERRALLAFLDTLTSPAAAVTLPELPR